MVSYKLDNKEFTSINQLAEYTGINVKTLTARLRRGMDIEDACKKTDYRCRYINGKSVTQICIENNKDTELVMNRFKYGYSLHDALNRPKKITKQGAEIVVDGILYSSLAAAIRTYGLQHKESLIRRKIGEGEKPEDLFAELSLSRKG